MSVQVKQLKSYLGSPAAVRALAWVLLAACLALLVLGIAAGAENGTPDFSQAVEFFPGEEAQKGEFVWVDVVGVSEWIFDVGEGQDVYYLVVDNLGYGYIAKMTKAQFAALSAQHRWFMSDEEHPAAGGDDVLSIEGQAEEFFPGEASLAGEYVWVNAIGVSDWVFDNAGRVYYVVMDDYGYGYIAAMTDAQFAQLSELNAWFMTDEDIPAPPAVYLTGISTPVSEEVADAFREVWGYEDIQQVYDALGYYYMDMTLNMTDDSGQALAVQRSYGISRSLPRDVADAFAEVLGYADGDEVREQLGSCYLDMTGKPGDDSAAGMLVLALVSGLGSLFIFLTAGRRQRTMKKCVKRLHELGLLEDAATQLNDADIEILGGDYVRLSRDYIFCRRTGAAVRYSDVMWCYMYVQRRYGVVMQQTLLGFTPVYKNLQLCEAGSARKGGGSEMLQRVMQVIFEKNPAVLLGYNGQNAKAYRDRAAQLKSGAAQ